MEDLMLSFPFTEVYRLFQRHENYMKRTFIFRNTRKFYLLAQTSQITLRNIFFVDTTGVVHSSIVKFIKPIGFPRESTLLVCLKCLKGDQC